MTVSPPNRPWRLVVAPLLLAATSALGLLGAMSALMVLAGGAAGLFAGAVAGWSLTVATAGRASRGRGLPIAFGTAGAVVAVVGAPPKPLAPRAAGGRPGRSGYPQQDDHLTR